MALTQKLEIRQSQALVMTPQLMQAIKLLQLSNLDLTAYVEGELERNPLLERVSDGEPAGERTPAEAEPATGEPNGPAEWQGPDLEIGQGAIGDRHDTRPDNVFPDDAAPAPARPGGDTPLGYSQWANVGSGGRDDADYNLEAFLSAE